MNMNWHFLRRTVSWDTKLQWFELNWYKSYDISVKLKRTEKDLYWTLNRPDNISKVQALIHHAFSTNLKGEWKSNENLNLLFLSLFNSTSVTYFPPGWNANSFATYLNSSHIRLFGKKTEMQKWQKLWKSSLIPPNVQFFEN